ncbi:hypothetical protein ACW9KT_01300 [Hymenobacter sp. HD11105]
MKKALLLTPLLSLGFLTAHAQISKGTVLIGGNIGYSQSTTESKYTGSVTPTGQNLVDNTSRSFSINPNVGYFLADNLLVGASVGFSTGRETGPHYSTTSAGERVSKHNSFSVAPFLRYYYLPIENFGFYGQVAAGYYQQKQSTTFDSPGSYVPNNNNYGGFASITPALVFFPISQLGLELTAGNIGYTRTRNKPTELMPGQYATETTTSNFGANFGLSNLTLGASYYIGRQ